jgi:hypothetical protein
LDTLRIIDCDQDDDDTSSSGGASTGASSIVNSLKRTNTASEDPADGAAAPKIRAETDSTKLRQFLKNLDGDE